MPTKTLKQWLSDQQAPAHIQEKLEELFRLPEKWKSKNWDSVLKHRELDCASDLERILHEI